MKPVRPAALIELELQTATAYKTRYDLRPSDDPLVAHMREANEAEIERLREELERALSGSLQVTLDGVPVEEHRITVPYLNRVLETLQSSYRSVYRSMTPDGKIRRSEATLSVAGTGGGSFSVDLTAPPAQLSLLAEPLMDQALEVIIDLLASAQDGRASTIAPEWAAQADEHAVRSMIRLSAALAGSRGTTTLRWRNVHDAERLVVLSADSARDLAVALAGETGREIITVTGHLEMGQDRPPRVRVRTADDEYLAEVKTAELLDRVKELLFEEVVATLVIDMRTSPSTGSPDTDVELLDLDLPLAG